MSSFQGTANGTIRVGVSACLLGQKVRYDGEHKRDHYLTDILGKFFQWVPVCPEVEAGLSVPRTPMRLESHDGDLRVVTTREREDLTRLLRNYSQSRVTALGEEQLSGYLLKKNSPSCGMERVKVFQDQRSPRRIGRGLFAEALLTSYPNLPVEEEGRLNDPCLREHWVTRVFTYHRLHMFWKRFWTVGDLVQFHTAHKFLLLAHSPNAYRELGRIVAQSEALERSELQAVYETQFMAALSEVATRPKNTDVLRHILGIVKRDLDKPAKKELLDHICDYHEGLVPLVVPLTLMAHYIRVLDIKYLQDQVYLHPHPKELALRNEV